MKKVLSLVLVLSMILSSMSFAFASESFEDIADTDYAEAIETLTALGVVTGYEDGTYRPENIVTRAEMAKLMVELLGYGDLVAGSKSNFADTQGHWADAWIALAAGRGIAIGDPNGNFRPNDTVTYDEVYTMLVRGLGYTDDCNELKGMTWPTNFKVKAAELDITKKVNMNTNSADRGGVAQAMANALESTLVTVTVDGDVTLLQDTFNGEEYDRLLLTRLADADYSYKVTEEVLDPDNKNYGGDLVDLESYMFENLQVYLNDDDEVVYVKESNSLVIDGTVDEVDGLELTIEEANGKTKDIDFDINNSILNSSDEIAASYVFENGSLKDTDIDLDYLDDSKVETIKVIGNDDKDLGGDGDGKLEADEIEGIVITKRSKVVRIEKEYVEGKDSLDGIDLPVDSDDDVDLSAITVKGDADSLEDIRIDDIVVSYVSENEDVITLIVTRDSVEGKVTRVYDADTYYIDGVSYDTAIMALEDTFELGDEGTFFLDHNGEIADYDGESVGPTDYAVILGSEDGDVEEKYGRTSVDTYPGLKLATQEGEEVIYELEIELDKNGLVEGSVEINDSKVGAISEGNIFAIDHDYDDGDTIDIESIFIPTNAYLVKYSLNSDDRIDEIDVIAEVSAYEVVGSGLNDIDLDKDELADGVIVFDAGDDYDVVDVEDLNDDFEAYAVENKHGDIEVLVVRAGEVDEAASTIYAYLNKVTLTYNDDGDKVNQFVMYVDGKKVEVLADDDNLSVGTYNYAISFDYNGEAVDSSDVTLDVTGVSTTATAINASKGRIELDVPAGATYNDGNGTVTLTDKWYTLSEHATIIEIDSTDNNSVDDINDLYDIDKGDVFEVFFNTDGDIDLIVITK